MWRMITFPFLLNPSQEKKLGTEDGAGDMLPGQGRHVHSKRRIMFNATASIKRNGLPAGGGLLAADLKRDDSIMCTNLHST